MQKITIFFLVFYSTTFSVQAQYKRRVLLEEFTQASCVPCAENNPVFNALLLSTASIVTPIKYQTPWPGSDPMYFQTAEDVNHRINYYNVPGVPDLLENGKRYPQAVAAYTQERINNAYNKTTPVTISLTHRLNAKFDSVFIEIAVKSESALTGDLRLHIAVTEANISFSAAPGSNGETSFYSVMRKMLPDANGIATGSFLAGEKKTYRLKWAVKNFYNLNQVETIAWLQHRQTKEVWQSARSQPNVLVPGGNFAKIILSSTSAQQLTCERSIAPMLILKNLGSEKMTHASILYTVDNKLANIFKWTGDLNTNASVTIQLPTINFETSGYHVIKFNVQETNQGVVINQVESGETMTVNAFFESVSPALTADFESDEFPLKGWGLKNERTGIGWSLFQKAGALGSSQSVLQNFYDLPFGRSVDLILPQAGFNTQSVWMLSFDHSYVQYEDLPNGIAPTNDRLRIDVSVNCGNTWATIFDKSGMSLRTAPAQTAIFQPESNQWEHNEVFLDAYKGQTQVLIRFRATSDYGNNLYLDNVQLQPDISSTDDENGIKKFSITPNPANDILHVTFALTQPAETIFQIYNTIGQLQTTTSASFSEEGNRHFALNISSLPSGNYWLLVRSGNNYLQKQFAIRQY